MLLPSFFVIDFERYDDVPDIKLAENCYLSYEITSVSIHLIDRFYRKLFLSAREYPFCLLLDVQDVLSQMDEGHENFIEFLVSFSFHHKYIKRDAGNPLLLYKIRRQDDASSIQGLVDAFKKHGYSNVETIPIFDDDSDPRKNVKTICFNLQDDTEKLAFEYMNSIYSLSSPDSSFFFFLENPRKLSDFVIAIDRTEKKIQAESPQIFYLLKDNVSLKAKERELLFDRQLLQEQLDSLDSYRSNSNSSWNRYKRQVTELLKFYNNEYEILPAWYKKFGHIIKVLMGKRSFRSLFDDNVKKYKD